MGRQQNRSNSGMSSFGSHAINNSSLVAATGSGVINPNNPGDMTNIRTMPVLTSQRTFTRQEADAMESLEAKSSYSTKHTVRALSAMRKVEGLDATRQAAYRGYQIGVANAELRKVKANAGLGKSLHGQRAQYAALGVGLQSAVETADQAVSMVSARLLGV
jgi:hypothetical protein